MTERFSQCIYSIVFKYVNDKRPNYLDEVLKTVLTVLVRSILGKIPERLKRTKNLNAFKHYLKEHYSKEPKTSIFFR